MFHVEHPYIWMSIDRYKYMKILCISNQKGGVGKTTTALSLAFELSHFGYRTLLIDLDPQANATSGIGFESDISTTGIYQGLLSDSLEASIHETNIPNLWICPSHQDLAAAELELVSTIGRELKLKDLIESLARSEMESFDFVVIDTPPTLGLLTINALTAATHLVVPMQCEYFALEGLSQLKKTVDLVQARLNRDLKLFGILLTMFDSRNNLSHQVAAEIERFFPEIIFKTRIPRNIRLSESTSFGKPIQEYDPRCRGAQAYQDWGKELLKRLMLPDGGYLKSNHIDNPQSSEAQYWN